MKNFLKNIFTYKATWKILSYLYIALIIMFFISVFRFFGIL